MTTFKCPDKKALYEPAQIIKTSATPDQPEWFLPLHTDGTLCGPWCQENAERKEQESWCDGSGSKPRKRAPWEAPIYGPGQRYPCPGCPRCQSGRKP